MARIRVGRWAWVLVLALAAVMAMSACGGDNNGDKTPTAGGGTPKATTAAAYTPGPGQTNGVTDTEILLGAHLPLSGYAAAWGVSLKKGMDTWVSYINDQGGINGRKLRLIVEDDQYTGPLASEVVRKLVEQDKVFAIVGGLGTVPDTTVYKYLETNGVPDMWLLAGQSKFTDPVAKNRFGYLVDYTDEGRILGEYIAKNYPGKKVGIIEQNDDFGAEGEAGIRLGVASANNEVVVEKFETTENDLAAQVQRLKNQNIEVMVIYGEPLQTTSAIRNAHETLSWNVPVVITGVDAVEIVGALAGYNNIEGTVSVVFGHQAWDVAWPGIATYRDAMAKYASGTAPENLTLTGANIIDFTAKVLKDAGQNLTRDSFLKAAESLCGWESFAGFAGATVNLSPTDHRPIEVEQLVKATTDNTQDPPVFKWAPMGDPIIFESTPNCP